MIFDLEVNLLSFNLSNDKSIKHYVDHSLDILDNLIIFIACFDVKTLKKTLVVRINIIKLLTLDIPYQN